MAASQITALPTAPSRGDSPNDFSTKADAWVAALDTWTTEANTVATEINSSSTTVSTNASSAEASAQTALAGANFIGAWSSQTGALTKPSSVVHQNTFWALLDDISTASTSEPGVSADWVQLGIQNYITCASAQTVENNTMCFIDVSGGAFTLTLPATPVTNQPIKIQNSTTTPFSTTNLTIAGNGNSFLAPDGTTDTELIIDYDVNGLTINYDGTYWGWS